MTTEQDVAALYNELELVFKYNNNCVSNINKKGKNKWTSRFLQARLTTFHEMIKECDVHNDYHRKKERNNSLFQRKSV